MYTVKRAFQILREDGVIHLAQKASLFIRYRRPIGPVYRTFVVWKRRRVSPYDAFANPYKKLEVDPNTIQSMSGLEYDIGEIGKIVDGNWDLTNESFEEYDMHQGFKQRFIDDLPWSETIFYQRVHGQIENGKMKFGCETVEELNQRCKRLDKLYESIKTNGYLSGDDRAENDPMDGAKRKNYLDTDLDEIKVDIGRNGEFLFVDGRHRLSMTKILDIDTIPVIVMRRHTDWQRIREQVFEYNGSNSVPNQLSDYSEHPDLQNM